MLACTFFGHKDCPETKYSNILQAIQNLITKKNITTFYVGTQGNFDSLVYRALCCLRADFPQIRIYRVLAYMTKGNDTIPDSTLPEGIEFVHPRYAIDWRNRWMIERSDYVIDYVTHNFGRAAKYVNEAKRKEKNIPQIKTNVFFCVIIRVS